MATLRTSTITDEVLDFLATNPTPQQIIDFRASEMLQERLRYLLDQNREGVLTTQENSELDEMQHMNHFMAMLKARVRIKLMEQNELHS
ncbi:MAG: hypothetical protein HY862_20380 [Chloroflexi bacterium]|nr:hypothetical protein [Chloroflexota bacterium]